MMTWNKFLSVEDVQISKDLSSGVCSSSMMETVLFVGPVVHTKKEGMIEILDEAAVLIKDGKIMSVGEASSSLDVKADKIIHLQDGQLLIPGFIDCHIHAVQLPNLGIGYDRCLMEWLEKYTFPLERKYSDVEFANRVYDTVVEQTLNAGTTTACYFASLYGKSSVILAEKASKYGQRAFIGKVNMNAPRDDGYCETTEESLQATTEFINDISNIDNPLIKPVVTPRFALSCDMDLMKGLAKLAEDKNLLIQTHVSENLAEIEICKKMYPECSTYVSVYEEAGLLTKKTVLAHGVHLEDSELEILKNRKTSIIHCPTSNTCLRSGLCDVKRLKSKGINVGLGTDVAGGHSVSILDVMRSALQVSTHLAFFKKGYEPLNYIDVFYLATLGGAKALAIEDQVGSFEPGKQFDALIIDTNKPNGPLNNLSEWTIEEQLQRFIYSGDDRNISQVFVAGHQVK
ncbi:probable guanine deaminase isoform X1 [Fopius arisanus]|uniref:Guanine deaminase n=2 Tax=Fopius arisanus TaxID=64838 RepID=A0A9R1T0J6_9HYME|nr:PREDICTED: probable guanine deaminase isoform X1 [Fopius arisanus]